jgi:hypothetical protein
MGDGSWGIVPRKSGLTFRRTGSSRRSQKAATEAERLVVQRIGQGIFRAALMGYWGGCPNALKIGASWGIRVKFVNAKTLADN